MSQSTVIRNAQLVNEGLVTESDILLKNGRIISVSRASRTRVISIQSRGRPSPEA
jgi:dihydroorotase-like cyclic amidohydrolase